MLYETESLPSTGPFRAMARVPNVVRPWQWMLVAVFPAVLGIIGLGAAPSMLFVDNPMARHGGIASLCIGLIFSFITVYCLRNAIRRPQTYKAIFTESYVEFLGGPHRGKKAYHEFAGMSIDVVNRGRALSPTGIGHILLGLLGGLMSTHREGEPSVHALGFFFGSGQITLTLPDLTEIRLLCASDKSANAIASHLETTFHAPGVRRLAA